MKIAQFQSPHGKANFWQDFGVEEAGSDLIEYSLLLAFVCLVGAGAFIAMGGSVNTLWSVTNSRLANP